MCKQLVALFLVLFVSIQCVYGQGADTPVWVAFDDYVDGPRIGGFDIDDERALRMAGAPNYDCKYFDTCPAGTAIFDTNGNYKGCTSSCAGTCTRCSGSNWNAYLCVWTPGDTCDRATSLTRCGKKGTGNCFVAPLGTGDNNGCGCTVPTTYLGGNCVFANCLDLAGP